MFLGLYESNYINEIDSYYEIMLLDTKSKTEVNYITLDNFTETISHPALKDENVYMFFLLIKLDNIDIPYLEFK